MPPDRSTEHGEITRYSGLVTTGLTKVEINSEREFFSITPQYSDSRYLKFDKVVSKKFDLDTLKAA